MHELNRKMKKLFIWRKMEDTDFVIIVHMHVIEDVLIVACMTALMENILPQHKKQLGK